jgi:hypothetical protein
MIFLYSLGSNFINTSIAPSATLPVPVTTNTIGEYSLGSPPVASISYLIEAKLSYIFV